MKVFVQNWKTRDFLDENYQWQSSLSNAKEFESSGEAAIFCVDRRLSDAQIVLKFEGDLDALFPIGYDTQEAA